jgi:hypothetical protein
MKKVRRVPVVPTISQLVVQKHERAREELRRFSRWVDQHDPELLAASVTQIDSTLESCARIDQFFRRYTAALKGRVVD